MSSDFIGGLQEVFEAGILLQWVLDDEDSFDRVAGHVQRSCYVLVPVRSSRLQHDGVSADL